uniref:Uncharacterized protein n=1 Tax=Pipistrellus kuhlii TaxID=59472 RepID=A0A7J7ZJ78_PIPKU|nr:hypothetical protein mPipKuh1_009440 [Pipistrellus kuhlii]
MNPRLGLDQEGSKGQAGRRAGKRGGGLWSGRLTLPRSPAIYKDKSQEEERGAPLPAPNLIGCRISLWLSLGLRRSQTVLDCAFIMASPARRSQGNGHGGRRAERGERKGGALPPQGWGVPGLLSECRGGQGQAAWLDGENRDAEEGLMGNGPMVSGQGWGQALVHQSQVSCWGGELREGQRAEIAGRVVNPRMQGGEGRT